MKKSMFAFFAVAMLTACGGGGGENKATPTPPPIAQQPPTVQPPPIAAKPLALQLTSYDNRAAAGQAVGSVRLPNEVASGNAVAMADFLQNGTFTLVTHTLDYIPNWSKTEYGKIRFYQRAGNSWSDITSKLLKDTTGCLHPRKAVVADFNGDAKPDVFFACHGYDREPFPGEEQRLLLSQNDGTYKNQIVPITCFCHGAAAVDISKNGYADIVIVDNVGGPVFLKNNRDGTFTMDKQKFSTMKGKSIFTVEIMDLDNNGNPDIVFGGTDPGITAKSWESAPQIVYMNEKFDINRVVSLTSNSQFATVLDFVVNDDNLYILRTNSEGNNYGVNAYTSAAVQVISLKSQISSIAYTHNGPYANGSSWVNWLIPTGNTAASMDSIYNIKF